MKNLKITRSTVRTLLTAAIAVVLAGCPGQSEQVSSSRQSSSSQVASALVPTFNTSDYVLKAGDTMTGVLNAPGMSLNDGGSAGTGQGPAINFTSATNGLGTATHQIFGPYNSSTGLPGAFYFGAGRNSADNSRNGFIFYNAGCSADTVGGTDHNCNAKSFQVAADQSVFDGVVGIGTSTPSYTLDVGGPTRGVAKIGGRGAFFLAAEAACLATPSPNSNLGQGARNLVWEVGTTRTCAQACAAISQHNSCLSGWTMWEGDAHFQYGIECTTADPASNQGISGKLCCCNNTNNSMSMYGN